jgi:hypothetical protein
VTIGIEARSPNSKPPRPKPSTLMLNIFSSRRAQRRPTALTRCRHEPKFQRVDALRDGLALVTVNGKAGFIDRTGSFAIEPVFDKAWWFKPGLGRTSAERDGIFGVIDKTGAWVFRTDYQQIHFAVAFSRDRKSDTVFGWHFKKADRWGLLDLDGRVVLDADFDQTIQRCADDRLVALKNNEWLFFKGDGSPLQPPDGRLIGATCNAVPPTP